MQVSEFVAAVSFGPYVDPIKVAVLVVVLLVWARMLAWMADDAPQAKLPAPALNAGLIGGMAFGFILFLALPGFTLALIVMLTIMALEAGAYLGLRAQKVGLADLGKSISKAMKGKGGKKGGKKGAATDAGQLVLMSKKGAPMAPPESETPEAAGYSAVQNMLTEPLRRNAERIEMRPTDGASSVKYFVDGVPVDARQVPREDAAAAITLLKQLGGLDLNDRRKPQQGTMKIMVGGKKRELQLLTAGTTAGESVAIDVDRKQRYELTIDQLGLSDDQLTSVDEIIGEGKGIVLLAAPKGHGLTSLMYAVLRRHDAFLSHIQTIERDAQADLEGIKQNPIPNGVAAGEEAKLFAWMVSQQPDIVLLDRIEDPRTAAEVIRFAATGRRAYVGMRTGSTFEALQAWRNLVGDDKLAMKHLRLVVATRLVRKLCAACKTDFNPDPDTLRKLNMPPERVGKLFTARTSPLKDARGRDMACEFCQDLRFRGRTGVFELFITDDEVKQVVVGGGSVNQLKMLFKKQRQKYLQEQALALAVAGETSLNEIARVLKAGEAPSGPGKKA